MSSLSIPATIIKKINTCFTEGVILTWNFSLHLKNVLLSRMSIGIYKRCKHKRTYGYYARKRLCDMNMKKKTFL